MQDPSRFSQAGLAAIYDAEPGSNLTASGEAFDPTQLTAAHPTLPIPSYARITNLANGRMIVVRINDRGPYGNDRVISLSRAAADRLNTSNNTKVRIDPIIVARMVRFLVLVWLVPQSPNRLTPCLHLPI
ncbi:rare lipoprotein A [Escherichia coli]|uniref:Endolytic peptidoglycan transglycosylase RlpA n=1 Tax=Escherichia coli TaxID=562 RepID=A0A376RM55_ECOLX|nr:rare lipoprotein A [Escherichia coli]